MQVPDSPVFGLGYVIVRSSMVEEWSRLASGVLGMSVEYGEDGSLAIRMDERVARFIVESPRLGRPEVTIGWECRGEKEWHEVASTLEKDGITIQDENREGLLCRESFACLDPNGVECEFFYGGCVDPAQKFVSPVGASFVTGDQGMGHVTLAVTDCQASLGFYENLLGFQVRETKTVRGKHLAWAFLSPNSREHCIALMSREKTQLLHVLVEVSDIDTVGRAMDQCLDGIAPLRFSLGRHWNDEMLSFYVRTPSGFDIEYGCGGRRVDVSTWTRREQGGSGRVSLWGHRVVRPDGTLGPQLGQH